MALFKKNQVNIDAPSKMSGDDFQLDVEEDFPSYTPTVDFSSIDSKNVQKPLAPKFNKEDFMDRPSSSKPLFIKIEKYEDAVNMLNSIKERLGQADEIINELKQIRQDEDSRLNEWADHLKSIKDKLSTIDNSLFD